MARTKDINSFVMAGATEPQPSQPARPPGSKPYVAEVGALHAEGLRSENARLKAERAAGGVVLMLDPKLVRPSKKYSNRDPLFLSKDDPKLLDLAERLKSHGQIVPIGVYSVSGDGFEYEIMYGHRRHAACLLLNTEIPGGFKIKAIVDPKGIDEDHVLQAWYGENANREDVTAYEYAQRYSEWLKNRPNAKQADLADKLGLTQAGISQYLSILQLPAEIFEAYGSKHAVRFSHLTPLAKALREDRAHVLALAKQLASQSPRLPASETVKVLTRPRAAVETASKTRLTVERKGRVAVTLSDDHGGKVSLKLGALVKQKQGSAERFSKALHLAAEIFVDKELAGE
jgi:ParB family transcriptional regulator, chromosome partitioning protein